MSRAKWLEAHLVSKVKESPALNVALGILNLTKKLSQNNFTYPVKKVDAFLGYSKTQSNRIFNEWLGLSTLKYQRMMQFTQSIHHIHSSEASESHTDLRLRLGYYDQAHFIRSFKEFAEITPGQYKKIMTRIPGQLIL